MVTVVRQLRFLVLVGFVTLFTQRASAAIAPILESSHHDGSVFYSDDGLYGRIDFAVYDTHDSVNRNEYEQIGITAPGEGQYIYAYQIFNDLVFSVESVAYFAVLAIEESVISGIGAQEDPEAGTAPSEGYFDTDQSKAVWEFDGGEGYILAGEHSWFLVFSSDQDWVKGDFEIRGPEDYVPVPEPATIALLGLAGTGVLMRRRKIVH
jgi:hypothetical protein